MQSRLREIIEILLNVSIPIKVEEVAERLDVSVRTIRNDVKEINAFLKEHRLPTINNVRQEGMSLKFSDDQLDQLIFLLKDSELDYYSEVDNRIFNLILSFAFHQVEYIYEKQEEFQISKSSMDNDLKTVREIISKYNLELESVHDVYQFVGSEKNVRVMLFNIINEYAGIITPASLKSLHLISIDILTRFISSETLKILSTEFTKMLPYEDEFYKNQMILFLAICIHRIKAGYPLLNDSSETLKENDEIILFLKGVYTLLDIDKNIHEINYTKTIIETLTSKVIVDTTIWSKGQFLTVELIEYMEKSTGYYLRNQEILFTDLFKHVVKLINRLDKGIQINNPLTAVIKKDYQDIFKALRNFDFYHILKDIIPKQVRLTDDEIGFLTIYFVVALSRITDESLVTYKAVIICHFGKATGQLLSKKLEDEFNIDIVAVLSSNDTDIIYKLDVDIAFSTIELNEITIPKLRLSLDYNHKEVEYFLEKNSHLKRVEKELSSVVDGTKFFNEIMNFIQVTKGKITNSQYNEMLKIFNKNNLNVEARYEERLPVISDVLYDNHILLDIEADTWAEAIAKTAVPLLESNVITEDYKESMIQSVEKNGPYIVIAPHVAMAHAKPEDGANRIGLSISRIKEGISFNHSTFDPVKIVICFSFVDSYSHMRILQTIYKIINNEEKMQSLLNTKSKSDFEEVLKQGSKGEYK